MKCPSCNGVLYYDIKNKNLKCRYCKSVFEIDDYNVNNTAEENDFADGKLYTCKNCGAELISANDEAVSYCSYCGSEAILEGQISGIKRPKLIIPFRISKTECKNIYKKALEKKAYVPSEFKDPDFIDRFRPFYIPYWMYRISFRKDDFDMDGYKSYTVGNYDYYEEYKIRAHVANDGLYGVPYDASRNFDDTIAERIAPFNSKGIVEYKPGYLAGMYADSPNVDADTYKEEVMEKATDLAFEDISKSFGSITLDLPKKNERQEFLGTSYESQDAIFLPVWFLTWKKNDRVAYAVVNGQTGKIHIDLPADINNFLKYTLCAAVILFVILSLFFSVTSRFVIWFSSLLAYLVSVRYRKELKEIRNRENHVFDKGYLINDKDDLSMSEKARTKARRTKIMSKFTSVVIGFIGMTIGMMLVSMILMGEMYDLLVSQDAAIGLTFVILVLGTFTFFKTLNISRHLKNKSSILISLITYGSLLYSFIVAVTEPVQDWWYYLGSLICLFATSIMAFDLIGRFNETSTRPLPSFYTRKGGNDSVKES